MIEQALGAGRGLSGEETAAAALVVRDGGLKLVGGGVKQGAVLVFQIPVGTAFVLNALRGPAGRFAAEPVEERFAGHVTMAGHRVGVAAVGLFAQVVAKVAAHVLDQVAVLLVRAHEGGDLVARTGFGRAGSPVAADHGSNYRGGG